MDFSALVWRPEHPAHGRRIGGNIVIMRRDLQLSTQWETRSERVMSIARLVALVGILSLCAHQVPPAGVSADHSERWLLMSVAAVGWIGWMSSRRLGAPARTTRLFLLLLAASGGFLAAIAPMAISFMAIAGLGAAIAFGGLAAVAFGVVGVAAQGVASLVVGGAGILVAEGTLFVVIAMMAGASRHQYIERTMQAEQLLVERVRADSERDRAAALTERNRIGREVHDVLAIPWERSRSNLMRWTLSSKVATIRTGLANLFNRLDGSLSRASRRLAKRSTPCVTSQSPWLSNSLHWPLATRRSSLSRVRQDLWRPTRD